MMLHSAMQCTGLPGPACQATIHVYCCIRSFRLHGGDEGLAAELRMDVKRMWLRNCGRDDRLVADRGREARHPFLDEQLMALILDLPLYCVADLRLQPGDASQDGVHALTPP